VKYLALPRVEAAVSALEAVGLGRRDAPVIRWMMLKSLGIEADLATPLTIHGAQGFAHDFFEFDVDERYGYFNPLSGQWFTRHPSDWGVQTLYTQLTRGGLSQREAPLYEVPQKITTAADKDVWAFRTRPRAAYLKGLGDLFRDDRLPVAELAVWRFRESELPDEATISGLAVRVLAELNVDPKEFEVVFMPDDQVKAALPTDGAK